MQEGIWMDVELLSLIVFVLVVLLILSFVIYRMYLHIKGSQPCVSLTASQKYFYGSLCQVSARRALVLSNVNIMQLSSFQPCCSRWSSDYRKIKAQKFDFVICRLGDFKPLAVIEYEGDKSPNKLTDDIEKICIESRLQVHRIAASSVARLDELDGLLFPADVARFVRLDNGLQVPARYASKDVEGVKV